MAIPWISGTVEDDVLESIRANEGLAQARRLRALGLVRFDDVVAYLKANGETSAAAKLAASDPEAWR